MVRVVQKSVADLQDCVVDAMGSGRNNRSSRTQRAGDGIGKARDDVKSVMMDFKRHKNAIASLTKGRIGAVAKRISSELESRMEMAKKISQSETQDMLIADVEKDSTKAQRAKTNSQDPYVEITAESSASRVDKVKEILVLHDSPATLQSSIIAANQKCKHQSPLLRQRRKF